MFPQLQKVPACQSRVPMLVQRPELGLPFLPTPQSWGAHQISLEAENSTPLHSGIPLLRSVPLIHVPVYGIAIALLLNLPSDVQRGGHAHWDSSGQCGWGPEAAASAALWAPLFVVMVVAIVVTAVAQLVQEPVLSTHVHQRGTAERAACWGSVCLLSITGGPG